MASEPRDLYRDDKRLFHDLFSNSPDGILLLNPSGRVVDANQAFQLMFGYSLVELQSQSLLTLIGAAPKAVDRAHELLESPKLDHPLRSSTVHRRKNGQLINVDVLAYPLEGDAVERGLCVHYKDVTDREQAKGEAAYRKTHDELTGLLNRAEFERRVSRTIEQAQVLDLSHVFLYIDLDQFKIINDACGHKGGDRLLVEVADWLCSAVRESDSVARLGGDEFGLLLVGCGVDVALGKAQAFLKRLADNPFQYGDKSFPLGASIGVVEINSDTPDLASALISADAACYTAKEKGRNRTQLYIADDEDFMSRRAEMAWVGRLNTAVEENRFVLLYQEIVGLGNNMRRHRELLIRYREDDGTLVPPGAFIPSAERYNLMPVIDRWVLRHACERLALQINSGEDPGVVSINVSGTSLNDDKFAPFVEEILRKSGVPGEWICFEITETAAIANLQSAQQFIERVKRYGCSVALDDFGSGMSSFNYLRSLAVDYLKIDGIFIRDMDKNGVDSAMAEAINNVGKVLGLKTVAEFVETPELTELLRKMGVDFAQGYGLHKPELWTD